MRCRYRHSIRPAIERSQVPLPLGHCCAKTFGKLFTPRVTLSQTDRHTHRQMQPNALPPGIHRYSNVSTGRQMDGGVFVVTADTTRRINAVPVYPCGKCRLPQMGLRESRNHLLGPRISKDVVHGTLRAKT